MKIFSTVSTLAAGIGQKARTAVKLASLALAASAVSLAAPMAHAGEKVVANKTGQTFTIRSWSDGLRRDKYSVHPETGVHVWYADGGSANAGRGETGRRTNQSEWCRVRYLYGDNVRIPECWGSFMYSSHLITGLDGDHYELWFSPSSLSYYKIRNQEKDIWYAHDGSSHNGKNTTKDDWCRVIVYHGAGILQPPKECDYMVVRAARVASGLENAATAAAELISLQALMGIDTSSAASFGGSALKAADSLSTLSDIVKGDPTGFLVGVGVEAVKDELGLRARNANAGEITAEIVGTTAATTSISTMIMAASGSTLNPVAIGAGALVAGGIAAGQAIAAASEDTGIVLKANYGAHPRYNRDLNNLTNHYARPLPLPGAPDKLNEVAKLGYIANQLSGLCVDVNGDPGTGHGANVALYTCDPATKANTDHRWEFLASGHIRNKASNRCLDVAGAPGTANGSNVGIADCEMSGNTDQLWDYTNKGQFRNRLSGRCLDVMGDPGTSNGSNIIIADCEDPNKKQTDQVWLAVTPYGSKETVQKCANENQVCNFVGSRLVTYGAGDKGVTMMVNGPISCSNKTFGDPVPNVVKSCSVTMPAPTVCADENGVCNFTGVRAVTYGAGNQSVTRAMTGPVRCNNGVFGDPAPGVRKSCSIQ